MESVQTFLLVKFGLNAKENTVDFHSTPLQLEN